MIKRKKSKKCCRKIAKDDPKFGTDGLITFPFANQNNRFVTRVYCDGKILVGTSVNTGNGPNVIFVRYNCDGSIDKSFGTDGVFDLSQAGNLTNTLLINFDVCDCKVIVLAHNRASGQLIVFEITKEGKIDSKLGILAIPNALAFVSVVNFGNFYLTSSIVWDRCCKNFFVVFTSSLTTKLIVQKYSACDGSLEFSITIENSKNKCRYGTHLAPAGALIDYEGRLVLITKGRTGIPSYRFPTISGNSSARSAIVSSATFAVRVKSSGEIDCSFGRDGFSDIRDSFPSADLNLTGPNPSSNVSVDNPESMIVLPDNSIIINGYSSRYGGAIVKLDPNGFYDCQFRGDSCDPSVIPGLIYQTEPVWYMGDLVFQCPDSFYQASIIQPIDVTDCIPSPTDTYYYLLEKFDVKTGKRDECFHFKIEVNATTNPFLPLDIQCETKIIISYSDPKIKIQRVKNLKKI